MTTKLTREQLDELDARIDRRRTDPRYCIMLPCPEAVALIAQARRALELEERIAKLSESLHNGSGNPYISGVDEHLMRHVSERLRKIVE